MMATFMDKKLEGFPEMSNFERKVLECWRVLHMIRNIVIMVKAQQRREDRPRCV